MARLTPTNARSRFQKFKLSSESPAKQSLTEVVVEGSPSIRTEAIANQQMLSFK